jgi:hypothetical protein
MFYAFFISGSTEFSQYVSRVEANLHLYNFCCLVSKDLTMKPDADELIFLRTEFGKNKIIPPQYEYNILKALSFYPELKKIHIQIQLKNHATAPYGTAPATYDIFLRPGKRKYTITLQEQAQYPIEPTLFKNLPEEARLGIIGHELAHVVQYNRCSGAELLAVLLKYPLQFSFRKKMEMGADKIAIEHGLGEHLYYHATFIRSIPGYEEKRKKINKLYLLPDEIREYINKVVKKKSHHIAS